MGEWSKKIGELGEGIVGEFLDLIGWGNSQKGLSLPRLCIAAEQFWSVRKINVLKPLLIKDFDLEDKINVRSLMNKMSNF